MVKRAKILILALISVVVLILGGILYHQSYAIKQITGDSPKTISDEELLKYAQSSYDKSKMMGQDIMIGSHNGIPVKVTFPCSDVCPDYTIRVIRYDVELDKCEGIGGIKKAIYIPSGIAVVPRGFCFPKIIVSNKIYDFAEDWILLVEELEKIADKINYCNVKSDCAYKKLDNCHFNFVAFNKNADLAEFNTKFAEYKSKLPPCDNQLKLDYLACETNKCIGYYSAQY
jgi:hypothetical protein